MKGNKKKETNTRKKQIKDLMEELNRKDEMLKKNIEQYDIQVQQGLAKKGLPLEKLYTILVKEREFDIEETEIMIESGMEIINPTYAYHNDKRWVDIQVRKQKDYLERLKKDVALIKKDVEEVKNDIVAQNGRIKERKIHIIEELEKLGEDVKDLKNNKPNYIG